MRTYIINLFLTLSAVFIVTVNLQAQCSGYSYGGPSTACKNTPTNYYVYGGNTSSCSLTSVTGPAASRSGSTVTFFANGTYTLTYSCSCGTATQSVTVVDGSANGGTLNRTNSSICAGGTPLTVTVSGYANYISRWEKRIVGQSTWTNISSSSNTLSSTLIDNQSSADYRALIQGSCGVTTYSPIYSVTVNPNNLTPPLVSAATNISTSSFTANWSGNTPNYWIDVSTSNTFDTFLSGYNGISVSSTSVVVSNLSAGTSYYYRVRSESGGCISDFSTTQNVLTLPAAPVLSSTTNITTSSFTANWNSVNSATGYLLDVSTSSDFLTTVGSFNGYPVSGLTFVVTGLSPGTTYYYRLRATNTSGNSAFSNSQNTTTIASSCSGFLFGGPSAACKNTPTNYFIYGGNASGCTLSSVSGPAFSQSGSTVTFFANGTYSLNYGCSCGTIAQTVVVSDGVVNAGLIEPQAATICSGAIPPAVTVSAYSEYIVQWERQYEGQSTWSIINHAANTLPGSLMDNSTSAMYRAKINGTCGATTYSPVYQLIISPLEKPVVTISQIEANSFYATWTQTTGYYLIDVATDPNFTSNSIVNSYVDKPVVNNNITICGLNPSATYYFRVRAYDGPCMSSNSTTATVITLPVAPIATSATLITSNSFRANWLSVPNVNGYKLVVASDPALTDILPNYNHVTVTGAFLNVTGLASKTTYYYAVKAFNASGESRFSNVIRAINLDHNFVSETKTLVNGLTSPTAIESASLTQVQIITNFFDGLGRNSQRVSQAVSPSGGDFIEPYGYDEFGRMKFLYLPYTSGNDGWFKPDFLTADASQYTNSAQYQFYQNTPKVAIDAKPYAETIFEPSPLNRPDKSFGPGADWHNNDRHIKHGYLINQHNTGSSATQEKIIAWVMGDATNPVKRSGLVTGYIVTGGYYATGQLQIKSTKDEHGNEVREYTNKSGQVILKKVQATTAGTSNLNALTGTTPGWALTYYVYDDFGNLRFVLPPELSKLIHQNDATAYNPSTTELNNWAFQYKYDGRRRMVEKKVPGAGWVHMVYDKRDRLVLTQDGVQRPNNRWLFTKYDALNRPVLTGMYTTATGIGRDSLQTIVNNYYANLDANKDWFETFTGNATDVYGYDNKSFPKESLQGNYLSVTYYDDYTFLGLLPAGYDYVDEGLAVEKNGITYHQPDAEFTRVKGLVTGTKVKVLNGGATGYSWLNTVSYYDDRYRVVQIITDNHKNSTDRITNVYDFMGTVLQSKTTHNANDLHWKDLVGVQFVGDKFTRTASSSGWGTSGAASVEMLPANEDGWFEFTAVATTKSIMVGYSPSNADANWTSIKYALYLVNNGTLQVRENGGGTNYLGSGHTYQAGDRFRIERKNGKINYYKNGVFLLERNAVSDALLIDFSINSSAGELAGFRSSFGAMGRTPSADEWFTTMQADCFRLFTR